MNVKTALIHSVSAVPGLDQLPPPAPLTCSIDAASLVCLVGGKVSVINAYLQMLAGTADPYSGSVYHADSLINQGDKNNCPAIAYIYHDSALLSVLNGIDNVKVPALYHRLAPAERIDEEVHALAGELEYGADHLILPAFMSALQRRHLLIVRAIMLKPGILFIENPFSNLDEDHVRIFGRYIVSLVRNKNITVVTGNANQDFVRSYADQIIYIEPEHVRVFDGWETFFQQSKDKSAMAYDEIL